MTLIVSMTLVPFINKCKKCHGRRLDTFVLLCMGTLIDLFLILFIYLFI